MKWKNHMSIARSIARALMLTDGEEEMLVEGSIDPDRNPDLVLRKDGRHIGKMPHHSPTTGVVMRYVWDARNSLLSDRRLEAMMALGRALHYIQDRSVGFSSRRQHDRKEKKIGFEEVDLEAVDRGIMDAVSSPRYVRRIVKKVKPHKGSNKAMSRACYHSAAIAAAVIGQLQAHAGLEESYRRSRRRHLVSILLSSGTFLAGTYGVVWLESYQYLALPIAGILLLLVDGAIYARRKDEARWFGLL